MYTPMHTPRIKPLGHSWGYTQDEPVSTIWATQVCTSGMIQIKPLRYTWSRNQDDQPYTAEIHTQDYQGHTTRSAQYVTRGHTY